MQWIVLLLVLLAGCPNDNGDGLRRGAAEGASNTLGAFSPWVTTPWPQKTAQDANSLNWVAVNDAVSGQTTEDFRSVNTGYPPPNDVIPWMGTHWHSDVFGQNLDVVVLTNETNDAQFASDYASQITVTPQMVVNRMIAFCADAPTTVTCFVTTVNIPPQWPSGDIYNFIVAENSLITATFPAKKVIDFTTGFSDPSLYINNAGSHFDQDGHDLRGQRAYNAILNY